MRRRALLTLAGGALAGVAGCGRDAARDRSGSSQGATATEVATGATTDSPTDASAPAATLRTARYRIQTFEANQHFGDVARNDVVEEDELAPELRDALREARDDGDFETADPSDALLAAIDGFRHFGIGYRFEPYVRLDGAGYEFDPTVPVFVAELDADATDADPARTAHWEDDVDSTVVESFVDTIAITTAESPRDAYRRSILPDRLRAFLEQYDYLKTPRTTGRIVTDRVDPGPPYTITVEELTDEDWWGRAVIDAMDLSEDLREFLEAAVNSDRRWPTLDPGEAEYRADSLPDAFADTFGPPGERRYPFVRLEGTVYRLEVTEPKRDRLPVELDVEVVESGETGATDEVDRFALTVRTVTDGVASSSVGLRSSGFLPSVLWVETDEDRVRLETARTERIDWYEDAEGRSRIENRVHRELPVGETLSTSYRVPDAVPAGNYVAWGTMRVSWDDEYWSGIPYPFQVELDVREQAGTGSG